MARVIIDVGVMGEDWFRAALDEMLSDEKVTFPYSKTKKFAVEHEAAVKVQGLYKLVGDMGRREDVDVTEVQRHSDLLEARPEWQSEKDCDDPHIFALVYCRPTRFVFSVDEDMANCRRCMNRCVNSRYCRFTLIVSEANYKMHRASIFK